MKRICHTYDFQCQLAPVYPRYPDHDNNETEDYPPLIAQFFYSSTIPIDDPLLVGNVAGSSEAQTTKGQLRPFSPRDNIALEKAWLDLSSPYHGQIHQSLQQGHVLNQPVSSERASLVERIVHTLAKKHAINHVNLRNKAQTSTDSDTPESAASVCCPELKLDIADYLCRFFCSLERTQQSYVDEDNIAQRVVFEINHSTDRFSVRHPSATVPKESQFCENNSRESNETKETPVEETLRNSSPGEQHIAPSPAETSPTRAQTVDRLAAPVADDGLSGKPFVRAQSVGRGRSPQSRDTRHPESFSQHPIRDDFGHGGSPQCGAKSSAAAFANEVLTTPCLDSGDEVAVDVPVGVARLHTVSLPTLQMRPIYWSPVNDMAVVLRATWFYR
jgi:hypothetical protein